MRTLNQKIMVGLLIVIVFFLASCGLGTAADLAAARLELTYAPEDTKDTIRSDFDLPTTISDATVTWESSDPSVIMISNDKAVVTRGDESQVVILTATIAKFNTTATKQFELTVLRKPRADELFTITWIIEDKQVETIVEIGLMPKLEAPRIDGLTFKGWYPSLAPASQNTTYNAMFEETKTGKLPDNMMNLNEWQLSLNTQYSGIPSIGQFDVLVIPIEVKDAPFDSNYRNKIDLIFNGTEAETGWQSVSTYYYLSSYGKLDINFDISVKYTTKNNRSFYQNKGDYADEYAIYEAVTALNPTIDFSKYDYNDDGIIDGVIFVYSVDYSRTVDCWWAWVYDASEFSIHNTPTLDSLRLGYYMWISYSFASDALAINTTVNAETFIHEMGHMLGQTDLYSKDDYSSGPLGDWDMMDYNSGDHNPFSKLIWGWIDPIVIYDPAKYQINIDSYATDNDGVDAVILIPRSNANFNDRDAFDEYLLVIFYTPQGLYNAHKNSNVGVSSAGVVVYHVDARLASRPDYWNIYLNDNSGSSNFLIEILEADKNNSIPSRSSNVNINISDFLTRGSFDLSSYRWNQGGSINVVITLDSIITNYSTDATLTVDVY